MTITKKATKKTATNTPATVKHTDEKQISVKPTNAEFAKFDKLCKTRNEPQTKTFLYLLSLADMPVNLANDPLFAEIVETAKNKGLTVEKFIINACKKAIKQAEIVRENPADKRIDDYVQGIMETNLSAKNWYEKIEITQVKIADATGCNRPAITKYLAINADNLTEHYALCDIEIDKEHTHNRKVSRYLTKETKGG